MLLGDRNGTFLLPLERIAVERAVSRVATGAVNGDGWAKVIVAHRESGCLAVLQGRGAARIDQLVGSRGSLRA